MGIYDSTCEQSLRTDYACKSKYNYFMIYLYKDNKKHVMF